MVQSQQVPLEHGYGDLPSNAKQLSSLGLANLPHIPGFKSSLRASATAPHPGTGGQQRLLIDVLARGLESRAFQKTES